MDKLKEVKSMIFVAKVKKCAPEGCATLTIGFINIAVGVRD